MGDQADADLEPVIFDDRMSDSDALMWSIEKDPMLRSTITTAVVVEGDLDRDQLQRTLERASRIIPRLRQRVRANPLSIAPPRWEIDPNFDLRYHLRAARAPGAGTMGDLLAMAGPVAMQGFDRARPLWEATVVEGLSNDRTAIILKVHHAITDGVGGVRLMLELFDLEPNPKERPMPSEPEVHVMNQTERFIDAFNHERRRQGEALRQAAAAGLGSAVGAAYDPTGSMTAGTELASSIGRLLRPGASPLSPIMTERSLSNHFEVLTMPLDMAKKVGHRIGGTLNDTFVGGIARGLRLYHQKHGEDPELLRMGMPINIRDETSSSSAGNAFVPARLELPMRFDDPEHLLRAVRSQCLAARDEPANQLVAPMSNLLNRLPTTVVTQIFGSLMRGLDFQASNVPGSPFPLYLLGRQVQAVFPFGPTAGASLNVTLLSYQNELNVGVNVDPAAVPDVDVFMECLRTGYDELLELA